MNLKLKRISMITFYILMYSGKIGLDIYLYFLVTYLNIKCFL